MVSVRIAKARRENRRHHRQPHQQSGTAAKARARGYRRSATSPTSSICWQANLISLVDPPKTAKSQKTKPFSAKKEVRAIARERVGRVKASQVITPKSERKPKHKIDPL